VLRPLPGFRIRIPRSSRSRISRNAVSVEHFASLAYFDVFICPWNPSSIRSGSFDPLRLVPDDKVVVLGLVSTKTSLLESAGDLQARIRDAARHFPLAQLALSPQCGFASSILGNEISELAELEKLKLVVTVARQVWH